MRDTLLVRPVGAIGFGTGSRRLGGVRMTTPSRGLAAWLASAALLGVFGASHFTVASAQNAVQWRVEDGGNGHWYLADPPQRSWVDARAHAESVGGHLATSTGSGEQAFLRSLWISSGVQYPWLGGYQDLNASDYSEPAGGWRWVTGEVWNYTNWGVGEPNNSTLNAEHCLHMFWQASPSWNDRPSSYPCSSIIEWSADCNNDGIVDYGQILDGSLDDG